MLNKKFIQYLSLGVFCLFFNSCFIKSKIYSLDEGLERYGFLELNHFQSINLIIDYIPFKAKNIKYYSEDGKSVKYISVHPKFSHNYVLIYPDYSELNPIALPPKREKIDSLTLKQYKASRISYYFKNQMYDCISQTHVLDTTIQETQKNRADLCQFVNRPAKELLVYLNADSNNTFLTADAPYSLNIFKWYSDIKVNLNNEESVLIKTAPTININQYDQLKENNVTLGLVEQFPIIRIEYYSNRNKKIIKTNCFISTNQSHR